MPKLLIFETHPIQYRAPIFQALQRIAPDSFEVVYASDFSVRGYADKQFGTTFRWDQPLLEGYRHRVLGNDVDGRAEGWSSLRGDGVGAVIDEVRPRAIMMSSFGYRFSAEIYWQALQRRLPLWVRVETQEAAQPRRLAVRMARWIAYPATYRAIARAFYIGTLNKAHFRKFGVPERRLSPALYCTANRLADVSVADRIARREALRTRLGIAPSIRVLGFFGKLIPKKNPLLILEALASMSSEQARRFAIVVVGTGELEAAMRDRGAALEASHGVHVHFAGFVNQSAIDDYYLATDIAVLPSRAAGETWGLVVNEAFHAGCAVAASDAVGCTVDFADVPRMAVFPSEDAAALADAMLKLATFERDFTWQEPLMANYSVEAAARSIADQIALL